MGFPWNHLVTNTYAYTLHHIHSLITNVVLHISECDNELLSTALLLPMCRICLRVYDAFLNCVAQYKQHIQSTIIKEKKTKSTHIHTKFKTTIMLVYQLKAASGRNAQREETSQCDTRFVGVFLLAWFMVFIHRAKRPSPRRRTSVLTLLISPLRARSGLDIH